MPTIRKEKSVANFNSYQNYVRNSMRTGGIRLSGKVKHPFVTLSSTNAIIYNTPNILSYPVSTRNAIIQPIRNNCVIKRVQIHMSVASILMETQNVSGLKSIANTIGNTKDLYKEMYAQACKKNNSSPQEVEEFKKAWAMVSNGIGIKSMQNKKWNYINPMDVYKYFAAFPELVQWKKNCGKLSRQHTKSVTTYFGTQLISTASLKSTSIMNWEIQGTISDILALLIKHFDQEIHKRNLAQDILFYYCDRDEISLNVKKSLINDRGEEWVNNEIYDIFYSQVDNWMPFSIDII